MTSILLRGLVVLASVACTMSAVADAARQISWDDLTVKLSAADNPFATLSPEQLESLVDVAAVRDRRARGVVISDREAASERTALAKLQQAGINADRLLAVRYEIGRKQAALAGAVNPAMDGQQVRVPGYLLPLEFTGRDVSEFLLVPWVGACIHTPPPPANQIIHVKADKPFPVKGMFDAVWVTGRIAASASKRSVFISDGASEVDVGYSMRATQVEVYTQ